MNNEFLQYEQALVLKKLGFDEECIAFYKENSHLKAIDQHWGMSICGISKKLGYEVDDLILAPTYSRVFRWIRENYDINVFCTFDIAMQVGIIKALKLISAKQIKTEIN